MAVVVSISLAARRAGAEQLLPGNPLFEVYDVVPVSSPVALSIESFSIPIAIPRVVGGDEVAGYGLILDLPQDAGIVFAVAQDDDAQEKKVEAAVQPAVAAAEAKKADVVAAAAAQDDDPFGEPVKPAEAPADKPGEDKKDGGDKKEGDPATDEPIEIVPLKPMVDPDTVKVYLGDGSIVTGKLTMQEIVMDTEFGQLEIPVTKILSFTPGLDSLPKLNDRVTVAIEALGSADFKTRDAAQKELLAMGVPVRAELMQHTDDSNAERVKRIREVVAKLDEMADEFEASPQRGWVRGDTIVTDEFTVVGKIVPQEFTFESKYGTLGVALADIRTLKREVGGGPTEIRKTLALEGRYLATTGFMESKVRVQAGDKVSIAASGTITMSPWGSRSSVGPDGNTRYGNMPLDGQNFPGGALLAKVGSGKVFKVGTNHTFTADKAGELQFAIAIHPSYGRGEYSFPGQYELKVKVNREAQ